jgi:hypothetical protein
MAGAAKRSVFTSAINFYQWGWFRGLSMGSKSDMNYFYELVRDGWLVKIVGSSLPPPKKYTITGPDKLSNYFGLTLRGFTEYNKSSGEKSEKMKEHLFKLIFSFKEAGSVEARHTLRDLFARCKWNDKDKERMQALRAAIV